MNSHDLFDMIGDTKGEYLWDVQQVRCGAENSGKMRSPRRLVLIAAVVALCLLMVGCTVAYVQGWFAEFFVLESRQPLSDSQVAFLEENEQKLNNSRSQNGWTVELGSVISDGTRGYIIVGVTAPEGVSLERIYKDNVVMSRLNVGNERDLRNDFDLLTIPEGVVSDYSYGFREDGDGLPNTEDLVITLNPVLEECSVDPFGKSSIYHISIPDIRRYTVNEEVWDGVSDIVSFESIWLEEILVEGPWEFSFSFGLKKGTVLQQELLTAPFSTAALHWRQYGEDQFEDSAWFLEEHTVTSFVLKPLSAIITYELQDDRDARFAWNQNPIYVVLRDGREIELTDGYGGNANQFLLQVSAPIVLEEVEHIRMVDGTKIYMDGRVEPPEWKEEALPPAPDRLIPGKTTLQEIAAYYAQLPARIGIYAYYTDFDEDGVSDIAVWQDGGYIALCLMSEDGTLKEKLQMETGSDVQTRLDISGMCSQYNGFDTENLERYEILQPIKEFWQYSVQ